jgi:hypothetical protein
VGYSFLICIDESGDQGFTFTGTHTSSEWFIVCATIIPVHRFQQVQDTITSLKMKVGCPERKHLHFKNLKETSQRRLVVTAINEELKNCFRSVVVMVHKPCLSSPESFSEKNRLYFYLTRFALERASWFCAGCKEYREKAYGDGTAKVIFSGMPALSREAIEKYFCLLRQSETSIDWSVVDPARFEALSPNKNAGLQLADSMAGAFYCNDHPILRHRTSEWSAVLKKTLYRSPRGRYLGYGLKLFPHQVEKQMAQGIRCTWATSIFSG